MLSICSQVWEWSTGVRSTYGGYTLTERLFFLSHQLSIANSSLTLWPPSPSMLGFLSDLILRMLHHMYAVEFTCATVAFVKCYFAVICCLCLLNPFSPSSMMIPEPWKFLAHSALPSASQCLHLLAVSSPQCWLWQLNLGSLIWDCLSSDYHGLVLNNSSPWKVALTRAC